MATKLLIICCLLLYSPLCFAAGELIWYLAEGSTSDYDTWICIQNPNNNSADIRITYMDDAGNTTIEEPSIEGNRRYSRKINAVTTMNNKYDVSTKVESLNSTGIVVERTMYWTSAGGGGHCSKGANNTSTKWYLAEGATLEYDTWICIQNPSLNDAIVQITYMDSDGNTKVKETTVAAQRRFSQKINNISEMNNKYEVSTTVEVTNNVGIIVERSMYWTTTGGGGHCTLGATSPSAFWYLAEGSTRGYDTYICIQNPTSNGIDTEITFMDKNGNTAVQTVDIDANTRYTQKINDIEDMNNKDEVATKVVSTGGKGLIAERAMYWSGGGHCSIGTTNTSMTWYLAEGSTRNYDTWICIQNPNSAAANVILTYMDTEGNTATQLETISAYRRFSQEINNVTAMTNKTGVSTKIEVTNDIGIIVERAMYWPSGAGEPGGHCSIGTEEETLLVSCYGDSLTAGYPYGGSTDTYPAELQPLLQNYYSNGTYNVDNRGIGGWRADEVLADIQEQNWLAIDPAIVLLMVGGNDLAQEILDGDTPSAVISRTTDEVQSIIDLIKAHTNADGTIPKIIVSTTLPTTTAIATLVVKSYNDSLETNLTGMDSLITTNWSDFYDPITLQAYPSLMADSVHPNEEGYEIMAQNWNEAIQAIYTP